MMMTPVRRAWLISAVWIAVIVLESFGGSAENTGQLLYPLLKFFFPKITLLRMFQIHFCLRKAGHLFGYCVLSFTLYRSWWVTLAVRAGSERLSLREMIHRWDWRAVLLSLAGTLAVAGLDEWHQSFNPLRGASIWDVALDECGGLLTQSILVMISSVEVVRRTGRALRNGSLTSV